MSSLLDNIGCCMMGRANRFVHFPCCAVATPRNGATGHIKLRFCLCDVLFSLWCQTPKGAGFVNFVRGTAHSRVDYFATSCDDKAEPLAARMDDNTTLGKTLKMDYTQQQQQLKEGRQKRGISTNAPVDIVACIRGRIALLAHKISPPKDQHFYIDDVQDGP